MIMPKSIDLNCDMGESYGPWKLGDDAEIIQHITSANVACGAHAGDPNVMWATVALAKEHRVAVGAHPGFPDLQGFGRRPFRLSGSELRNMLLAQLGALWAIARAQGVELHHVKPHGSLYNMACADTAVAAPLVSALRDFSVALPLYCLPTSALENEACAEGLEVVREGFVDRAYEPNGSLAERGVPGSVLTNATSAAQQAVQLAHGSVTATDGSSIQLLVQTLCVHGDTPGAATIAAKVRSALEAEGYNVTSSFHD
jgi:UPF0271 protein